MTEVPRRWSRRSLRWNPRSLRFRLALLYTAALAVVLAIVLAAVNVGADRVLVQNTIERLEADAGLISNGPSTGTPGTALTATEAASAVGGDQTAVTILDTRGNVLAGQSNGAPSEVVNARLDPSAYESLAAAGGTTTSVRNSSNGDRVLIVAAAVRLGDSSAAGNSGKTKPGNGKGLGLGRSNGNSGNVNGNGSGTTPDSIVQLAVSLAQVDATLAGLRIFSILLALAVLALASIAVGVWTGLALRPLGRIATAADRIAGGELSARAEVEPGPDEVARLGRAFDRMAERLDSTVQAQRQFAADASHELRSPLTVLGGYVDVLARRADDPATRDRALAAMRAQIDRLSRLAADLLTLTQLEAGGGGLQPGAVDLAAVVEDVVAACATIAGNRRLEFERQTEVTVVADPDRLSQVILNLVDNAVRHTPEEGRIRVSVRSDAGFGVADVLNDGEPIRAGDLPRIWDRFYRSPDRASGQDGHAGLGLAIVKAIVEASGGSVSASSDANGTRFTVRLPLSEPADLQHRLSQPTATRQFGPVS